MQQTPWNAQGMCAFYTALSIFLLNRYGSQMMKKNLVLSKVICLLHLTERSPSCRFLLFTCHITHLQRWEFSISLSRFIWLPGLPLRRLSPADIRGILQLIWEVSHLLWYSQQSSSQQTLWKLAGLTHFLTEKITIYHTVIIPPSFYCWVTAITRVLLFFWKKKSLIHGHIWTPACSFFTYWI